MTTFQPKPEPAVYDQDWSAYNKAQCNEKKLFMQLLADLCRNVEQPLYEFGRPCLPLSDMIFASALKVYSTFSLRRFVSDMKTAFSMGLVDQVCSYSTVSNTMTDSKITPILHDLIKLSGMPLVSVEKQFAVDSSGFSTSRFARYFSYKHGRDLRYKTWIKAHLICGVKTNIVTSVELSEEHRNDYPYFQPLVERTAQVFDVKEVFADKAYSGRSNYELTERLGGTSFIPFKSNATWKVKGCQAWAKMFHYFMYNREEFMKHYHKRSNAETVFHMIKSKFRDNVRSREATAQFNEVLKILCHNICVVIQEIHELGIAANFSKIARDLNA